MTMPHLMNCPHSETGWCLDCVKEQWEELRAEQVNAGKYEQCLQAAAQRLQSVLPIGEVKAIGLMEVPNAIDELIYLHSELHGALKSLRLGARHRGFFLRELAAWIGLTPSRLSELTTDTIKTEADFVD